MKKHAIPATLLLAALPCVPLRAADKKNQKTPSELDRYVAESMARGQAAAAREPGSLWTPYAGLAGLGLDLRAKGIDDLLTIVVTEQASAVATGTVKTQRNSAANVSITALGKKTNPTGALANPFGVTGSQSLDGQGSTSRETTIATTLTARVTLVLPNGNLLVEGRKIVGVNSEEQVVVLRGILRPVDLAPDNSVSSDRLAQMEVSVNGKGVLGDAIRRPMFLYRLLLGILPF